MGGVRITNGLGRNMKTFMQTIGREIGKTETTKNI